MLVFFLFLHFLHSSVASLFLLFRLLNCFFLFLLVSHLLRCCERNGVVDDAQSLISHVLTARFDTTTTIFIKKKSTKYFFCEGPLMTEKCACIFNGCESYCYPNDRKSRNLLYMVSKQFFKKS